MIEQYVEVKYENGEREYPLSEAANFMPGINGFSNYLCDVCGCILEKVERPYFQPDGSLACEECHTHPLWKA